MYNPPPMPLPKSILCKKCTRTYPEGWKICPYCKFDPLQARREAESNRMLARRGIKVPAVGKAKEEPKEGRRDPRGRRPKQTTGRPPERGNERQTNRPAQPPGRSGQPKRQGPRPGENPRRPATGARAGAPAVQGENAEPLPIGAAGVVTSEKRGRRRRRGRKPGQENGSPEAMAIQGSERPAQPPRAPRPAPPPPQDKVERSEQGGGGPEGDSPARKRRRRFRKRRGPGGSPDGGSGPATPQE